MTRLTPSSNCYKAAAYMSLNFVLSVLLISVNKALFQSGFKWSTLLTMVHFGVTALGMEMAAFFGLFEKKFVKASRIVQIAAAFCGFVVFTNLSLKYNVVGVYQILKSLTLIIVPTIEYFRTRDKVGMPYSQQLSLLIITVGVIVATTTSVHLNVLGSFFGCCALFSTSFYQVWVGSEQVCAQRWSRKQFIHCDHI
eukprot:Filipodium_phascolosomae@DN2146_c0_g1_i1.p1